MGRGADEVKQSLLLHTLPYPPLAETSRSRKKEVLQLPTVTKFGCPLPPSLGFTPRNWGIRRDPRQGCTVPVAWRFVRWMAKTMTSVGALLC